MTTPAEQGTAAGPVTPGSGEVRVPRILVVDDDQRNVRLMESILRTQGYEIIKAYNGEEAQQQVDAAVPDLILLDVMMPKMSGFELCEKLKGRHETRLLPIVMVTALNALEDKVQALEIGADDFLSKPINKVELLAKVRAILRVKTLQDEVARQASALERANQELLRMQQFRESMTQMVVHDLKNPLAGIMGNLQLMQLQKDDLTAGRLGELMQRSQESARQLMRMILNILQVGKLEEQKMPIRLEAVLLHEVVQHNFNELMSLSLRDGIRLESRVSPGLSPIMCDRELIGRVLANLLNNAFKHTPSGGAIVVDASPEGEEVVLTVSDTGTGIPEDLLPRIFDKFVAGEADNSRRMLYDSGLGLTFCKLAVQSHGGRIWIRSQTGTGTTVFVALPVRGQSQDGGREGAGHESSAGVSAA